MTTAYVYRAVAEGARGIRFVIYFNRPVTINRLAPVILSTGQAPSQVVLCCASLEIETKPHEDTITVCSQLIYTWSTEYVVCS